MLHIPGPMPQGQPALTFAQWGTPPQGPPFPSMLVSKHIPSAKKNAPLRHMQGLIKALQSVTISLLSRACLYPPSKAARLFSCLRPGPMRFIMGKQGTFVARCT